MPIDRPADEGVEKQRATDAPPPPPPPDRPGAEGFPSRAESRAAAAADMGDNPRPSDKPDTSSTGPADREDGQWTAVDTPDIEENGSPDGQETRLDGPETARTEDGSAYQPPSPERDASADDALTGEDPAVSDTGVLIEAADQRDIRQGAVADFDRGPVDAPGEAVEEPYPGIGDRQSDETLRPAEADVEDQDVDIRATPKPEGSPRNEDSNAVERQQTLGKELAKDLDGKVNKEINETLDKVNPRFDWTKSAYSENCTSVVQATELRRRGSEVEAGPLERHLRTDEGGTGGRQLSVIEQAWGRRFTAATKPEIDEAFKQPGSRGIVYIAWNGPAGGAHVFNVENVGGNVRYVDGQPTPAVTDASHYFAKGYGTRYLRLDDCPTPPDRTLNRFLEP